MNHDEYTDYSCSTPVERLARDVETLLRSWHLVGSDRHVSFSQFQDPNKRATLPHSLSEDASDSLDTGALSATSHDRFGHQDKVLGSLGAFFATQEDGQRKLVISESSSCHSTPTRPKTTKIIRSKAVEATVQMIRSENIQWIVNLANGGKVAVALALTLWDGPSGVESDEQLAQSLKRLPLLHIPHDPFGNLSTLFGIGQHLTLSLQPGLDVTSDLVWALGESIVQRHSDKLAPWMVTASFSGLLQTALQCAVSNIHCRIPAFGLWGIYAPEQQYHRMPQWLQSMQTSEPSIFPSWMLTSKHIPLRRRLSIFQKRCHHLNQHYLPPIVSANLLQQHSFSVSVLPFQSATSSRLTVWGQLLMKHSDSDNVVLSGARHVYKWKKALPSPRISILFGRLEPNEWRKWTEVVIDPDMSEESIESYRGLCQSYALSLLEHAIGASSTEPIWGPLDDPISSVRACVTWNGKKRLDGTVEELLSFPLKIRSRRSMTRSDWIEMEESVERTILNPLLPSSFVVQTHYDRTTSVSTLAASQRCLLAALIRTATLPSSVLINHLTNEALMDQWRSEIVESATANIASLANISSVTRQLVDAMDWAAVADDMIEPWQAQRILDQIFDGTIYLGFPSPPEEVFAMDGTEDIEHFMSKSAPPGRLVSLLFLHMARLRSPSSMSLLWMSFIEELRTRWDHRDSLPNMGHVPGLDPSPDLQTKKKGISTIGTKANYSAYINSSEPEPDDSYCLVGQKLQVFNLGIECAVALEMRDIDRMEQGSNPMSETHLSSDGTDFECATSVASTENIENESDMATIPHKATTGLLPNYRLNTKSSNMVDTVPAPVRAIEIVDEEKSMLSSSTYRLEFYDAREGSVQGVLQSNIQDNYTTNINEPQCRQGARCPVHGATLAANGNQLYAPYLQRPYPLTDDLILERRMMLSSQSDTDPSFMGNIQSRVSIAHRLQKPKLLSDMMAFKAANPGAVFQDFIMWYGDPGNPLDDYSEDHPVVTQSTTSSGDSGAAELNDMSETNQILVRTSDFWSVTWDEATACPAMDQEPLFDVMNTVEMVLDYLSTMHPASLMNQIMAVNLSSSYFALVASAGETKFIGVVEKGLYRLKEKTNHAIQLLSRDVSNGNLPNVNHHKDRLPRYASLESIRACETVCNAIAEAETLLCRAMSLLHKFPNQYDLVQSILCRPDSDTIPLDSQVGREGILAAIAKQQNEIVATPMLREYMLRNTDDSNPSQLCVRFGQGDDIEGNGLLIAMTESHAANHRNEGSTG